MPRLSDYLQREAAAVAPAGARDAAAQPQLVQAAAAVTAASTPVDAAVAAELARLQRQHAHRLHEHGPRLYRHPDGQLLPHPPAPQPLTVANRQRWSGLVRFCRQQTGVDQQLERTGVSARYNIHASFEQHTAAMAAIGLAPEADAPGHRPGLDPSLQDPLAGSSHPLATPQWSKLTAAVLERAVELHGRETLEKNSWQDLWQAVSAVETV